MIKDTACELSSRKESSLVEKSVWSGSVYSQKQNSNLGFQKKTMKALAKFWHVISHTQNICWNKEGGGVKAWVLKLQKDETELKEAREGNYLSVIGIS